MNDSIVDPSHQSGWPRDLASPDRDDAIEQFMIMLEKANAELTDTTLHDPPGQPIQTSQSPHLMIKETVTKRLDERRESSMSRDDDPNSRFPFLVDRLEAARLLCVSPGTIDNLRKQGQLPSLKIQTRRRYDVADLRRFIESRKEVEQ